MRIKKTTAPAEKTVVEKSADACAIKKTCGRKAIEGKVVTFTVHADKGKAVYVAGEFNNWNPTAKKMAYKVREGIYTTQMKLAYGTYQYKFVIDGTWCADPENVNAVANDQGTFNSVIEVK